MAPEKMKALIEEIKEVETLDELQALINDLIEDGLNDAVNNPAVQSALDEMRGKLKPAVVELPKQKEVEVEPKQNKEPIVRAGRKYKLLSTDVKWSTKPQVHALMAILSAHVQVGQEVAEEDIVKMMVANEKVLATRQGGKRVWDYYKGNTADGLQAHGNVERI